VLYLLPYHWSGYEWLRVQGGGAVGDYAEARAALETIRAGLRAGDKLLRQQLADYSEGERKLLERKLELGLFGPPPYVPALSAAGLTRLLTERAALETGEPILRAQEADLCVLEGLLAVEQGDGEAARAAFAEAQSLSTEPPSPTRFAAGAIAADYLARMGSRK
jgi:hypothetical protein